MAFVINGERVSDEQIEEEFESIKEHYINLGEVVCCDRDEEFQNYARENVINRTILEQESVKRFGEITETQVEARLTQLKEDHGGERNFYDNTGFNAGDDLMIRRKLKSSIAVDRLLEEELGEETDPTEAELRSFYDENVNRYMKPERVHAAQLFVEPESHEAARAAYFQLREVRRELLGGADFNELAEKHGTRDKGEIDLGWMRQGETMPEIEAIVFSMEEGEISPIVATHFGFHIFKLLEREAPTPLPFEEVEGMEEQFRADRRDKAITGVIEALKMTSTIEEVEEEPV